MVRYKYNPQIHPAAPFIHATVERHDSTTSANEVPALVDTGADITVIPQSLVESLQLVTIGAFDALGFRGVVESLPSYLVRITPRGLLGRTVRAIGVESEEYILLGRDVLNEYRIVLDGPNKILDIE